MFNYSFDNNFSNAISGGSGHNLLGGGHDLFSGGSSLFGSTSSSGGGFLSKLGGLDGLGKIAGKVVPFAGPVLSFLENPTDTWDSVKSIFGMGPVPRSVAIGTSDSQHLKPMHAKIVRLTENMTLQTSNQVLTDLDKFLSLYIANTKSGRHKAANTKAKQKHEITELSKMLADLRKMYSPLYNTITRSGFFTDVDFNGDKLAQNISYLEYSIKPSAVKKFTESQTKKVKQTKGFFEEEDNTNQPNNNSNNTMIIIIVIILALFGKKIF